MTKQFFKSNHLKSTVNASGTIEIRQWWTVFPQEATTALTEGNYSKTIKASTASYLFIYFCTHASTHYIYSNTHILHLICFSILKCLFSCNTNRGASAILLFAFLAKATKWFNQFPLVTFVHKRTAFRLRLSSSSSRSSPVHVTELTWNMG